MSDTVNFVSMVDPTLDPNAPSCEVCGAIMVRAEPKKDDDIGDDGSWECLSCGTRLRIIS